jgi:hypothetical protein
MLWILGGFMSAALKPVHFPAEDAIVSYLENHPSSKSYDKKIIKTVAMLFAKLEWDLDQVKGHILVTLYRVLKLEASELRIIQENFITALTDCAHGKPLRVISKL